jgi:hypothetical protein
MERTGQNMTDVVPHVRRIVWMPGAWIVDQLSQRQADAALTEDLERNLGQTIDEL